MCEMRAMQKPADPLSFSLTATAERPDSETSAVRVRLDAVELRVWAAPDHQRLVRSDFGDAGALADRLHTLITDDRLRAEMGKQSRAAFDLRLTAEGMLDRYRRAILAAAGVRFADAAPRAATPQARVA